MINDISPMTFDITYRKTLPEGSDFCLIYKDNSVLCKISSEEIDFPTVKYVAELVPEAAAHMRYLFKIDSVCFFTLPDFSPDANFEFVYLTKTELRTVSPQWKAFAAVTGMQIFTWYRSVSFCGFCGERTVHSKTERAAVCMKCGTTFYPKICPGVIVGIKNKDKLLLTKYSESHSPHRNYSLSYDGTKILSRFSFKKVCAASFFRSAKQHFADRLSPFKKWRKTDGKRRRAKPRRVRLPSA